MRKISKVACSRKQDIWQLTVYLHKKNNLPVQYEKQIYTRKNNLIIILPTPNSTSHPPPSVRNQVRYVDGLDHTVKQIQRTLSAVGYLFVLYVCWLWYCICCDEMTVAPGFRVLFTWQNWASLRQHRQSKAENFLRARRKNLVCASVSTDLMTSWSLKQLYFFFF